MCSRMLSKNVQVGKSTAIKRESDPLGTGKDLMFQRDKEVYGWVDGVAFDAEPKIGKSPFMLRDLP